MTQIGDIFTDENAEIYTENAIWANENNALITEIEPENNIRRFRIDAIPEHVPTYDEQKQNRAVAYQQEVDPITAHIQRLRDDEEPDEQRIAELIQERAEKVAEIKKQYPYPEESEGGDGKD